MTTEPAVTARRKVRRSLMAGRSRGSMGIEIVRPNADIGYSERETARNQALRERSPRSRYPEAGNREDCRQHREEDPLHHRIRLRARREIRRRFSFFAHL